MIDFLKGHNILGTASKARLVTLHPALQMLTLTLLERMDVTVVCGTRGEKEQDEAFNTGKSRVKFPNSKHNTNPSMAVDLAPYLGGKGIRWNREEISRMYGRIEEIADYLGIPIRWGGDWDMDGDMEEHKFTDLVHIELDEKKLGKTVWRYLNG